MDERIIFAVCAAITIIMIGKYFFNFLSKTDDIEIERIKLSQLEIQHKISEIKAEISGGIKRE